MFPSNYFRGRIFRLVTCQRDPWKRYFSHASGWPATRRRPSDPEFERVYHNGRRLTTQSLPASQSGRAFQRSRQSLPPQQEGGELPPGTNTRGRLVRQGEGRTTCSHGRKGEFFWGSSPHRIWYTLETLWDSALKLIVKASRWGDTPTDAIAIRLIAKVKPPRDVIATCKCKSLRDVTAACKCKSLRDVTAACKCKSKRRHCWLDVTAACKCRSQRDVTATCKCKSLRDVTADCKDQSEIPLVICKGESR